MYQVLLEGSELFKTYINLKYSKSTLIRIYNKGVGEMKVIREDCKTLPWKKSCAYRIVHNVLDTEKFVVL